MTHLPSTWVTIKNPSCRLYERGEIEGPAFVTSEGEQVYWVKFHIGKMVRVLMFGETEVTEADDKSLLCND